MLYTADKELIESVKKAIEASDFKVDGVDEERFGGADVAFSADYDTLSAIDYSVQLPDAHEFVLYRWEWEDDDGKTSTRVAAMSTIEELAAQIRELPKHSPL